MLCVIPIARLFNWTICWVYAGYMLIRRDGNKFGRSVATRRGEEGTNWMRKRVGGMKMEEGRRAGALGCLEAGERWRLGWWLKHWWLCKRVRSKAGLVELHLSFPMRWVTKGGGRLRGGQRYDCMLAVTGCVLNLVRHVSGQHSHRQWWEFEGMFLKCWSDCISNLVLIGVVAEVVMQFTDWLQVL